MRPFCVLHLFEIIDRRFNSLQYSFELIFSNFDVIQQRTTLTRPIIRILKCRTIWKDPLSYWRSSSKCRASISIKATKVLEGLSNLDEHENRLCKIVKKRTDPPYACHHNPLLIINRFWILSVHKARILRKKTLEKTFLDFKKWVKSIQTAGYNGARTVYIWKIILLFSSRPFFVFYPYRKLVGL